MTTSETIQGYFDALKKKADWQAFLSDDITFTSYTIPNKTVSGKSAYLDATKRFYSSITSMELRDVIIQGGKACALTHYNLQGPNGAFTSDVAEIFELKNGRITSFGIYFDLAPFPK